MSSEELCPLEKYAYLFSHISYVGRRFTGIDDGILWHRNENPSDLELLIVNMYVYLIEKCMSKCGKLKYTELANIVSALNLLKTEISSLNQDQVQDRLASDIEPIQTSIEKIYQSLANTLNGLRPDNRIEIHTSGITYQQLIGIFEDFVKTLAKKGITSSLSEQGYTQLRREVINQ